LDKVKDKVITMYIMSINKENIKNKKVFYHW